MNTYAQSFQRKEQPGPRPSRRGPWAAGMARGARSGAVRIRRIRRPSGGGDAGRSRSVTFRNTARRGAAALLALLLVFGVPQAILTGLGVERDSRGSAGGATLTVSRPAPGSARHGNIGYGPDGGSTAGAPEYRALHTGTVVTVKAGDTVWELAKTYGSPGIDVRDTVQAIIDVNDLGGSFIRPGMELYIP